MGAKRNKCHIHGNSERIYLEDFGFDVCVECVKRNLFHPEVLKSAKLKLKEQQQHHEPWMLDDF